MTGRSVRPFVWAMVAATTLVGVVYGGHAALVALAIGFPVVTLFLMIARAFPGRFRTGQRVAAGVAAALVVAAVGSAYLAYVAAMAGMSSAR